MIRTDRLQEILDAQQLDGIIITHGPNRRYLSGFTGSAGWLFIAKDRRVLVTDGRYMSQSQEQCPDWERIITRAPITEVWADLQIPKQKNIGFEADTMSYQMGQSLTMYLSAWRWQPTYGIVASVRMIKEPEEIAYHEKAIALAEKAFTYTLGQITNGMRERDLAGLMHGAYRRFGADEAAFEGVVVSGPRGALPHGRATDRLLQAGELVTLDFGATFAGYRSDITRTFALGQPSDELLKMYKAVQTAQELGINSLRPGITAKEADAVARTYLEKQGYGEYFVHSLGHGIGLDVHEPPILYKNNDTRLAPGMIVTVEPGVYIPGLGGVRIEDMLLITPTSHKRLTTLPTELQILPFSSPAPTLTNGRST